MLGAVVNSRIEVRVITKIQGARSRINTFLTSGRPVLTKTQTVNMPRKPKINNNKINV